MYDHDRFRLNRDRRFDPLWVYIVSNFDRLDGDGLGASMGHCQPGGDVGVGGDNNLIPRSDSIGLKNETKGVETVGNPDAICRFAVGGKFRFKSLDFFTEDVPCLLYTSPS